MVVVILGGTSFDPGTKIPHTEIFPFLNWTFRFNHPFVPRVHFISFSSTCPLCLSLLLLSYLFLPLHFHSVLCLCGSSIQFDKTQTPLILETVMGTCLFVKQERNGGWFNSLSSDGWWPPFPFLYRQVIIIAFCVALSSVLVSSLTKLLSWRTM